MSAKMFLSFPAGDVVGNWIEPPIPQQTDRKLRGQLSIRRFYWFIRN